MATIVAAIQVFQINGMVLDEQNTRDIFGAGAHRARANN